MKNQTITVTLPESIYTRLAETAESFSITREELLQESIALLLPALENDLSVDEHRDLSLLALMPDLDLWKIARSTMDDVSQQALERLASLNKQRTLTNSEQSQLEKLMASAEQIMLRKAEAFRLLALRGHSVFPTS